MQDDYGLYGLIKGDEVIIPCCIEKESDVCVLFSYMLKEGITSLNPVEAKSLSLKIKNKGTKFYIGAPVTEENWDF